MHRAWHDWRKRRMERTEIEFSGRKKKKKQCKNIFPLHPPSPFFFARLFFPFGRGVRELSGEAEKILTLITLSSEALSLWRCERLSWGCGGWNWSEDSFEESTEANETERMGWCQRSPVQQRPWNNRFVVSKIDVGGLSYWDSKEYHVFKIKPRENSTFPKVQSLMQCLAKITFSMPDTEFKRRRRSCRCAGRRGCQSSFNSAPCSRFVN